MSPPVIFLPGILMPAALRYQPLLGELGADVNPVVKELEVYDASAGLAGYTLAREVEGITRVADQSGFERFHLYGHSGGGAVSLAYVATHPERVLSVAVDEPATDFAAEHLGYLRAAADRMLPMSDAVLMGAFTAELVAPGVEVPPPPWGDQPPAWMVNRPAGVRAFLTTLLGASVDPTLFRSFPGPVYYSYGSLSNPSWEAMAVRLQTMFPDIDVERYEGLSHLQTSHVVEPGRVADRLRALWAKAEANAG